MVCGTSSIVDRPAEDAGVAAEPAHPVGVAEDDDAVAASSRRSSPGPITLPMTGPIPSTLK